MKGGSYRGKFLFGLRLVDVGDPSGGTVNGTRTEKGRAIGSLPPMKAIPLPILGTLDKGGAKGIPFDVAQDDVEVLARLARKRLEAALPNVAAASIVAVVSPHVRGRQPLHPRAKVAVGDGLQDQVEMIRHDGEGQHAHRDAFAGLSDQADECLIVGDFVENIRASVAAVEDMIAESPE